MIVYQISYLFWGLMLIIVLVAGGAIYLIQSGLRWTRPIKWRISLGAALLVALVLLMVAGTLAVLDTRRATQSSCRIRWPPFSFGSLCERRFGTDPSDFAEQY
jgi:cytochrome c oxidase subunit IV